MPAAPVRPRLLNVARPVLVSTDAVDVPTKMPVEFSWATVAETTAAVPVTV